MLVHTFSNYWAPAACQTLCWPQSRMLTVLAHTRPPLTVLCLLRIVDQRPCFSFYDDVVSEADGGGRLQDERKKGFFFFFQNSLPHTAYFLLSKPEWVRGLKSCMRKNLHLL